MELGKLIKNYQGNNLHIVIDNNNINDSDIDFCINLCKKNYDKDGLIIMNHMKNMRKTARGKSIYFSKF
jgi:hypothetical protein